MTGDKVANLNPCACVRAAYSSEPANETAARILFAFRDGAGKLTDTLKCFVMREGLVSPVEVEVHMFWF